MIAEMGPSAQKVHMCFSLVVLLNTYHIVMLVKRERERERVLLDTI